MPKASAAPSPKPEASAADLTSTAHLPTNYEDAMEELGLLVQRMEAGDMPLEALLSAYQRGAALLQFCRDKLQAVEGQIQVLDEGMLKAWKPQ